MNARYKSIVVENARRYSREGGVSFMGALLKSSLVPLSLFDQVLPDQGLFLDMGCGEGMLGNCLARLFPMARVVGVDLDAEKIVKAQACRMPNATFMVNDAVTCLGDPADVVVFNDMLHHNGPELQEALLKLAALRLRDGGLLVVKEVDKLDRIDAAMTAFFDSKMYPKDKLSFRTQSEWTAVLESCGFECVRVEKIRHPWVASRTVILATKTGLPRLYLGEQGADRAEETRGRLKVLVTGASGFIGHHVATHLVDHGLGGMPVDLILLARNPMKVAPSLRSRAVIVRSSLGDLPLMGNLPLFSHLDYVFHFAAEVKIHGDPAVLYSSNAEGTRNLLSIVKQGRLKRFIHASTMGAADRQPGDDCSSPMNERSEPHPLTDYGRSKLESERLVKASGLPYVILRIPWAFGPRMTADTHVRNLMERVGRGSLVARICFPGKVSLIAVEDLVRAFIMAATHVDSEGEVFFVAGHVPIGLGELFDRIARVLPGARPPWIAVPGLLQWAARRVRRFLPLTIQNLNSDVLCVDDARLRALGYQPREDLDAALTRLAGWIHTERSFKTQSAVVTGAASGIGLALSRKLCAGGLRVLMVDRNGAALRCHAETLGMPFRVLDLAKSEDVTVLIDLVQRDGSIRVVVNCAGLAWRAPLVETKSSKLEEIVNVNALALAKLTGATLQAFTQRHRGILINVSSSAALQPLPFFAVYSASKAFVSHLTEAVMNEVAGCPDVCVMNVVPSGTDTALQSSAGVKKDSREKLLSPEFVADRIACLVLRHGASGTYFIGARGRVMDVMARLLPRRFNVALWGHLSATRR